MPHLEAERLAALDHDVPTAQELAHLAGCAACHAEWQAYAALARLAEREARHVEIGDASSPPLTTWEALAPALRREGLLVDAPALARTVSPTAARVPAWRAPWRQAAAAAALLVVGALGGRWSASAPSRDSAVASVAVADADFESLGEASAVLDRAQRDYERASLWIAAHDTTVNAQAAYRARLVALEQMLSASRAGLYEAPEDPVLNQYYLAAYTAREATLRQLGAALPVDRVMESF
jgi:hypothetical protein